MKLGSAIFLLAMLARFVAASPVETRRIEARKPEGAGDGGNAGKGGGQKERPKGESKRGDFNVLGKRDDGPFLIAFGASNCNAFALPYEIYYFNNVNGGQCYDTIQFSSVRFDLNGEGVGWRPRVGTVGTEYSCFSSYSPQFPRPNV